MDTIRKGDKVRRKPDFRHVSGWTHGTGICTVAHISVDGERLKLNETGGIDWWDTERFEKVYENPHVPADRNDVVEDKVNSPLHYNYGKVETIDYIMQVCALYPGHQAALVANVIKYVSRAPMKGDKEKDLKKAQWYLNKLISTL